MESNPAALHQLQSAPLFTYNPNNKFGRRDYPPRSYPSVTSTPSEMSTPHESGMGMWTSPAEHGLKPRPATIHESVFPGYSMAEEYNNNLPAWDSSTMPMQSNHDGFQQHYSVQQQDFYGSNLGNNGWVQKHCDDGSDMQSMDTEMSIGQAYTTDEAVPVLDLRYSTPGMENESLAFENAFNSRRMSGSSFTLSTTGPLSEMPSYEDFSTTLSETPSFSSDYPTHSNRNSLMSSNSDYPPPSNRNSLMSSTQLSPVASPRMTPQNRSELVRTQSRGRASPSPRPTMRTAPYSTDSRVGKRWSTGSYAPTPSRRPSPFIYNHAQEMFSAHNQPRMISRHSSPTISNVPLPLNMQNMHSLQSQQQHPFMMSNNSGFHRNTVVLPSHGYEQQPNMETPPPLLSHGLFRMLQSNADPHSLHAHYTDLSDPPDLYASLHEEQIPPPPEDMNPSDPDLIPHEQELRFDGDLYTPRWVRGHGNKREGWCGICKPGRWLVLKNSAFWYDKSFTHGISAATGSPFQEPMETRRMDGNPDVWEGLCGSCNEWVALVSSKKKGTTWFRHAYKCHTHPKIKDAPKRRRESSHTRALAASTMAKPKELPQTPKAHHSHSHNNSQESTNTNDACCVSSTPTPASIAGVQLTTNTISPLEGLSNMI